MAEIPQPPPLPFLGNIREIDPAVPATSFSRLFEKYGRIYRLQLGGSTAVFVGSAELLQDLCDEKRFGKKIDNILWQVRNGTGDGLFTARNDEENWGIAHRVLMPVFGPMAINRYFDEMKGVAAELLTKWARLGPDNVINVTDQFTRLTLDSIALCSMDTRFNSFDREDMHPFVDSMTSFLRESGERGRRPQALTDWVFRSAARKYEEDIEVMKKTAQAVINQRRANPSDKNDILKAMLEGKDPKTGKGMSDENIISNMITFLIAGHETTSGMLSFLFVRLMQTPRAMEILRKEVDTVLGDGPILPEHMGKLPYLNACLRETLRLHPTAPFFAVSALSENDADYPTRLGKEGWLLNKGETIAVSLIDCQRDPAVWGEDAHEFKPERMLDENFQKIPPYAWKPFGNGARACIGRAFAWQEAQIAVALLLQNFTLRLEDPSYRLELSQALTIKPKGFFMRARLREGIDIIGLEQRLWGGKNGQSKDERKDEAVESAAKNAVAKKPMSLFYGSNTGTCDALAQSLASQAASRGYAPDVKPLDSATNALPNDRPVVIITASYEGEPPDNAGHFVEWLKNAKDSELNNVKYAVFGCGHTDWSSTYQKIPALCDRILEANGGKKICSRGDANAANNDMFNEFDSWCDKTFWPAMVEQFGDEASGGASSQGLDVEISTSTRSSDLRHDVAEGIVTKTTSLTGANEAEKRHIEILLPSGMSYSAGDYLAVLPINHDELIKSVLARFQIPWDARIKISENQLTFLPTGRELPIYGMLASYVELSQPATKKNVAMLAQCAHDESDQKALSELTSTVISDKHISVLDLLEKHLSIDLPFGNFLAMMPPMRVRSYSISSSPLNSEGHCSLTYAVLDQEAKIGGKRYKGICSNYLSDLKVGDKIYCSVKPSHQAFHLPLDVENVPIIMACAGSGLAPFHGFVQERAKQMEAGRKLAPALLFVGCRGPADTLYAEDFEKWSKMGAVDVRYAFSRAQEQTKGCKYVQDRLFHDRAEAEELWEKGARVFVCGGNSMGEGVREVIIKTAEEASKRNGMNQSREEVEEWFATIRNERYASDVFA